MESAAENSRPVDRRSPAEEPRPGSWISRLSMIGSLLLLGVVIWQMTWNYAYFYLSQADIQAEDGKYAEALKSLENATWWFPKKPGIPIRQAQIYFKMGNQTAATEYFQKAVPLLKESTATTPTDWLHFSEIAQQLKMTDATVEACERIEEMAGKYPALQRRLMLNGAAYGRAVTNRNCESGLKSIETALSLPEGMPSLTVSGIERAMFEDTRALLLHRLGRNEEALVDINRAVGYVDGEFKSAMEKRSVSKSKTGNEKEADSSTAKATEAGNLTDPGKSETPGDATKPETATAENAKPTTGEKADPKPVGPYAGISKDALKNWAIMLNHRQMIREALGDKDGAQADRARIAEMGYTPGEDLH